MLQSLLFQEWRDGILSATTVQRFPSETHRMRYQAGIWKRCLQQHPTIPSPASMGEELQFDWMDGKPAPDAVLSLFSSLINN